MAGAPSEAQVCSLRAAAAADCHQFVNRLPFLDWTRGLAVLIMIQCHAFNCLVRPELRGGGPYILSQFVGGMAAVLFLFLAGVTSAFQMERLDRRGATARQRLTAVFRRAGYMMVLAFAFRFNNALFQWNGPAWNSVWKVDILNCMGASMALLAAAALCGGRARARAAAVAGLAIACASPWISAADWSGVPQVVRDYLVPNRAAFALFPWSAYLAFGVAAGTVLRRIAADRMERALQWGVLLGFGLISGGQYFSNLPYSLYRRTDFWTDSPALVIIRLGVVLLILAWAYLWTEHIAGQGWSWMQTMGKTSLLVYWVHIMLVYGWMGDHWKKTFGIWEATAATVAVTLLMLLLAMARLAWSARARRPASVPAAARAAAAEASAS